MAHSHHNHGAPAAVVEGRTGVRRTAAFMIGGLTSGHGVFHWIAQSFIVVLPEVRDLLLGGSSVAVASIQSTREVVSGVVSLPGGVLTDALRRYWGWVMAACMGLFGIGWLLMASAGWLVPGASWVAQTSGTGEQVSGQLNPAGYALLLFGMAVVGVAASVWHLPAMAALSSHFRDRRGSVLSFHGVGGNVGDVIGPPLTGILLVALSWQAIISIYAVVPIFLTLLVFWAFRDIGHRAQEAAGTQTAEALRSQLAETKLIVRNARVWGIMTVAGLRGMAYLGFVTVLPLYLADELGLIAEGEDGRSFENLALRGGLIGLLVFVGIFRQSRDRIPVGPVRPQADPDSRTDRPRGDNTAHGPVRRHTGRDVGAAGRAWTVPVQRPAHPDGGGYRHSSRGHGGDDAGAALDIALRVQRGVATDRCQAVLLGR